MNNSQMIKKWFDNKDSELNIKNLETGNLTLAVEMADEAAARVLISTEGSDLENFKLVVQRFAQGVVKMNDDDFSLTVYKFKKNLELYKNNYNSVDKEGYRLSTDMTTELAKIFGREMANEYPRDETKKNISPKEINPNETQEEKKFRLHMELKEAIDESSQQNPLFTARKNILINVLTDYQAEKTNNHSHQAIENRMAIIRDLALNKNNKTDVSKNKSVL